MTWEEPTTKKSLVLLGTMAHAANDGFVFVVPALIPFYIQSMNISYTQAGLIWTLLNLAASIPQPFFGVLADRSRQYGLAAVGLLIATVFMSLTGIVQGYYLILLVSILGGLGTAVVHPVVAAVVASASERHRGAAMSFFVLGGNAGFGLSPLLLPPLLAWGGPGYSLAILPVGLVLSAALFFGVRRAMPPASVERKAPLVSRTSISWSPIAVLIVVVALRTWVYSALIAFLPTYLTSVGMTLEEGGRVLALMLLFGALGGLLGGFISDYVSAKWVTVVTLVALTIFLAAFFRTSGLLSLVFVSLAGLVLLASMPVTVSMAQKVLPGREALASGLMLGFGIGLGGLGVGVTGWMADQFGMYTALVSLVAVPFLAAIVMLPYNERKWRRAPVPEAGLA